jgi:hypothetical protein
MGKTFLFSATILFVTFIKKKNILVLRYDLVHDSRSRETFNGGPFEMHGGSPLSQKKNGENKNVLRYNLVPDIYFFFFFKENKNVLRYDLVRDSRSITAILNDLNTSSFFILFDRRYF